MAKRKQKIQKCLTYDQMRSLRENQRLLKAKTTSAKRKVALRRRIKRLMQSTHRCYVVA